MAPAGRQGYPKATIGTIMLFVKAGFSPNYIL